MQSHKEKQLRDTKTKKNKENIRKKGRKGNRTKDHDWTSPKGSTIKTIQPHLRSEIKVIG